MNSSKTEALLHAALDLFAERGYHGVSIQDIAKRSGTASGMIYYYFQSKQGLVNAVYRRAKQQMADAVRVDFPPNAPLRRCFAEMWGQTLTFARNEPATFTFLQFHHHADYLDEDSQTLAARVSAVALDFLRDAQAEGRFKPGPPELLMSLFLGTINGLLKAEADGWLKIDDATLQLAEQAAWDALSHNPTTDSV